MIHSQAVAGWKHEHTFGQDRVRAGEQGTRLVLGITAAMMVVEIVAGLTFGSMALLGDGMHMGSHAAALGISVLAYIYARKYARDHRFSFGTGKVNGLAGFTSAVLLAVFALSMAWQSLARLFNPVAIAFDQALLVAVIGLVVNLVSAGLLGRTHDHADEEGSPQRPRHPAVHSDHNLRAAYLHVLADASTSVLAIFALLGGKMLGLVWMDPIMGLVGAGLVAHWSIGLIRETSRVLLDQQGPEEIQKAVRAAIEGLEDTHISDFHLWSIGPGIFAAAICIVTPAPRSPEEYRRLIPNQVGLMHATIEVHLAQVAAPDFSGALKK